MNALVKILRGLLILCAIAGVYVAGFFLVSGLSEFLAGLKASPINASDIVWGVVKGTVLVGLVSAATYIILKVRIFSTGDTKRKPRRRR